MRIELTSEWVPEEGAPFPAGHVATVGVDVPFEVALRLLEDELAVVVTKRQTDLMETR